MGMLVTEEGEELMIDPKTRKGFLRALEESERVSWILAQDWNAAKKLAQLMKMGYEMEQIALLALDTKIGAQ